MDRAMHKNKNTSRVSTRRRSSLMRRPWILIVALIFLAIAITISYFVFFKPGTDGTAETVDNSDISSGSVPSETSPQGENAAEDSKFPPSKVTQFEGVEGNGESKDLDAYITSTYVDGDILRIRTVIDQLDNSGGTCDITMTSTNGALYKENTSIINSASTSSCYGYDIPVSALGSGKWSIDILVKTNGESKHINGEVEL